MTIDLTDQEKALIGDKIREKYAQAADSPAGCFSYPTGVSGPAAVGLPRGVVAGFSPGPAGVLLRRGQSLQPGSAVAGRDGLGPGLRRRS